MLGLCDTTYDLGDDIAVLILEVSGITRRWGCYHRRSSTGTATMLSCL